MLLVFLPVAVVSEQAGTPTLAEPASKCTATPTQPGGNMEGKEVRFGIAQSGLFAAVTTTVHDRQRERDA